MGVLRREVLHPMSTWRRPQALAGLLLASLLFATSLDALLLSFRLRAAAIDRQGWAAYERRDAEAAADRRWTRENELRLLREQLELGIGRVPAPMATVRPTGVVGGGVAHGPATIVQCDSDRDPLCGL